MQNNAIYVLLHKSYKGIFNKLCIYIDTLQQIIELSSDACSLYNITDINLAQFELYFSNPDDISDLLGGKIGEITDTYARAYFINVFNYKCSKHKLDYIELVCPKTYIKLKNHDDLPFYSDNIKKDDDSKLECNKFEFGVGYIYDNEKKNNKNIINGIIPKNNIEIIKIYDMICILERFKDFYETLINKYEKKCPINKDDKNNRDDKNNCDDKNNRDDKNKCDEKIKSPIQLNVCISNNSKCCENINSNKCYENTNSKCCENTNSNKCYENTNSKCCKNNKLNKCCENTNSKCCENTNSKCCKNNKLNKCCENTNSKCCENTNSKCCENTNSKCCENTNYHENTNCDKINKCCDKINKCCDKINKCCDKINNNKYCDKTNSDKYCDKINKYCDKTNSDKYCDKINKYCDKTNSDKYCDKTNSDKYCDKTNSGKYCDKTNSDKYCDKTNSDKYCDKTNSDKYCDKTNSDKSDNCCNKTNCYKKYNDDMLCETESYCIFSSSHCTSPKKNIWKKKIKKLHNI
jgi:hypothetical protein